MIKGVHHIALRPAPEKYEETVKFYQDILGMKPVRAWGSGENAIIMLSCGDNSTMEIISTPGSKTGHDEAGAIDHIALATDMVDTAVEKVREAGYEITVEPKDAVLNSEPKLSIRLAFCKGPIGEIVEFFDEK